MLQVAIEGELDQKTLGSRIGQGRSAVSKNVAYWSELTPLKTPGPGLIKSEIDPMNMNSRIISLTPKGRAVVEEMISRAKFKF